VRFDGYTKACGLFIPKARDYLPKPLVFEPCPAGLVPASTGCEYVNPSWTSAVRPELISMWQKGTRTKAGAVHLQVSQFVGDWVYRLVVMGDGNVEHAVLETTPKTCTLKGGELYGGRYAYPIIVDNGAVYGALAGNWSELVPALVLKYPAGLSHTPLPTPFGLLDGDGAHGLHLYSYETGLKTMDLWSPAQDNGLQQVSTAMSDDALFWRSSNAYYSKSRVYTPSGGVKELVSFGNDATQGIFGTGTDGTDLVWHRAFNRASGTGLYPEMEIVTAPYTTTPAALTPRRLRSETGSVSVSPFVVGCGFAANDTGKTIRLIRLSDGVSWLFNWGDKASSIGWTSPLALTCDHLFIGGVITGTPKRTIVKLRLDSLGPGIPPD